MLLLDPLCCCWIHCAAAGATVLLLDPLCCCWSHSAAAGATVLLQAVKDRMERALSQRMYLIRSTELDGFETAGRKFELVGSTGNLYTVVMLELL